MKYEIWQEKGDVLIFVRKLSGAVVIFF